MNHQTTEKGFKALLVYQLAFSGSMDIFKMTLKFPYSEKYALTKQIRNSSRSVCANIAEGYRKRVYPNHFISKISDSDGECSETLVWLDFAYECGYITQEEKEKSVSTYSRIGAMLGKMMQAPEKFAPRNLSL